MTTARAGSKEKALRLLRTSGISVVEFHGHENVAVKSLAALVAGLVRPKASFRQRNLYCGFDLNRLPAGKLEQLEAKATSLGDYILAGHLLREVDVVWSEQTGQAT